MTDQRKQDAAWRAAQQRHFERELDAYQPLYGTDPPFHRAMTDRFLALVSPIAGQRVLDLGCGFGRLTVPLLRAGCSVTGVDLSQATLKALEQRLSDLGLEDGFTPLCRAVEDIDGDARFDLVVGRGLLHHLSDPQPVLTRCLQVLVPGGRAAFMDPNPLQPLWLLFILLHPTLSWSIEHRYLRHTPRRQRSLLSAAGFESIVCEHCGLVPPPLWQRLPRPEPIEQRLTSIPGLRALSLYTMVSGRRPAED